MVPFNAVFMYCCSYCYNLFTLFLSSTFSRLWVASSWFIFSTSLLPGTQTMLRLSSPIILKLLIMLLFMFLFIASSFLLYMLWLVFMLYFYSFSEFIYAFFAFIMLLHYWIYFLSSYFYFYTITILSIY